MTNDGHPQDIGFEDAREELASIVSRLESGGLSLEESLALWQRGEEVAAVCTRWLDDARAKLTAAISEQRDAEGDEHEDVEA